MTELLAPAGSFTALKAALANGADAVYLGGKTFSARAFADNFTLEDIAKAVELAHFWQAKVYLAINTLLDDEEMPGAISYAAELYQLGVDAVIVQDLGLLDILRKALPSLPLHASTQMSIHNVPGCRLVQERGVERVILARELSFKDMKLLREATDIGLEVFVHGALCICYSGQCLFSSMIGGRSGNRGRCAQPCRMVYQLVNSQGTPVSTEQKGKYLLSPRDLIGYEEIVDLAELKMDAWKIEGRMKKPEYVATVSRVYQRMIQELEESGTAELRQEDMRQMLQVFNRDYSSGYWLDNPGAQLMSYARPNNRGVLCGRIVENAPGRIKIKLAQPLSSGDMLEIWVSTGKRETLTVADIEIEGKIADHASPGSIVSLSAKAGRSGDRVFKIFDDPLMEQARKSFEDIPKKLLHFSVSARTGQQLVVKAYDDDNYTATYTSDFIIEEAIKNISDMTSIKVQLGRLGNTLYSLGEVSGAVDENIMIPTSILNKCRRELVADIEGQRKAKDVRSFDRDGFARIIRENNPKREAWQKADKMGLSVLVADIDQAQIAAKHSKGDIYFDCAGTSGAKATDYQQLFELTAKTKERLIPYLPQIILPREEDHWRKIIEQWQKQNAKAIVVNNLGQIRILQEMDWQTDIYAGMGINCFNSWTCATLDQMQLKRVLLSPEMTLAQMQQLKPGGLSIEVFAQGALQLMVSQYCAAGALSEGMSQADKTGKQCGKPCLRNKENYNLRDEKGYIFPIRFDSDCRMHVFNSKEHCLLRDIPTLQKAGIDRLTLDIRLYPQAIAARLLDLYSLAIRDPISFEEARGKIDTLCNDYTKGHLYRGV